MEILYYFKPLDTKNYNKQVDRLLFLLTVSSKYHFFHLFLIYCGCEFDMETCFCVNCGLRLVTDILPLCC